MANYGQYCPVAKASELLGDRWTLLIVRELLFGPIRFTDIERNLPGISRSVLSGRLRRLCADGIAGRTDVGAYRLTAAGEALRPVVKSLGDWVARWVMTDPSGAEVDPELLMLYVSRHIAEDRLPPRRVVTEWHFPDQRRRIWLTMERGDISVCLDDPCLPVDVYVTGATTELFRVYMGRHSLEGALADGTVELAGERSMTRRFRTWMKWSAHAESSRRALEQAPSPVGSGSRADLAGGSPSPVS